MGKYDLKRIVEAGPESIANFDKFVKLTTCRMMSSHKLRNEYGHDIVFILDFEGLQISQLASLPSKLLLRTLLLLRSLKKWKVDVAGNYNLCAWDSTNAVNSC